MNKRGKIWLTLALALLLALSTAAQAEMYVEGFLGGTTAADMGSPSFHQQDLPPPPPPPPPPEPPPPPPPPPPPAAVPVQPPRILDSFLDFKTNGSVTPAVVGGVRIGIWFVPTGTLGCNYPSWMKYFGFYTDFSYHKLDVTRQSCPVNDFTDAGAFNGTNPGTFYSKGYVATWAFMFSGRYGFLPDAAVPFGRLQPYVGVGPAILFTGMKPNAVVYGDNNVGGYATPGADFSIVPALAVDTGVRYMVLRNVSVDLSFRYRYAQPNFNFNFTDIHGGVSHLNFSPTYHLFSGMLGVALHF